MWKQYIKILIVTLLLFNTTILVTANFQPNEDPILANSSSQTIVYVDPQNVTALEGADVTINVKVANVTNLYGLDIKFSWDPTLLDYVDHTAKIPNGTQYPDGILHPPFLKIRDIVNPTAGTYWLVAGSFIPAPSFNGTGIAFEMTFRVLREAACYLHFISSQLSAKGEGGPPIPHEVKDGNFWSTSSPSFAPIANFTFSPNEAFVNRTLVTINASTSYDPDGGNITNYIWDFGDGTSENTTNPVKNHTFQDIGCDVTLTVEDDEESISVPLTKHIDVTIYRDISVTSVQVPPQTLRGKEVAINVTVINLGDQNETSFRIDTYYNETAVDPTNITATTWVEIEGKSPPTTLEPAEEYNETFSWDTKDVTAEVYYYIMANASLDLAWKDVNLTNNVRLSSTSIYIETVPPVASFVSIPTRPLVNETITFDASASFDPDGNITLYEWDFGDDTTATYIEGVNLTDVTTHTYTSIGNYSVTLNVTDNDEFSNSSTKYVQVIDVVTYLDIDIDVGTIHFGGEEAEFYILVTRLGERVNDPEITAILYFNGSNFMDLTSKLESITTGFYRIITDPLPSDSSGTYTLHVEASYFNLKGNAIKSFLVSQTLTKWNPEIVGIENDIATIKNDLGQIKANLTEINATLVRIEDTIGIINSTVGEIKINLSLINATITDIIVDSKGEVLAKMDYYLGTDGTITVKLADLNATLTGIIVNSEGEIIAEIETALGKIVTTKLNALNATVASIEGNVITVTTELGALQTTTSDVQTTATNSLYTTAIFSVLATAFFVALLLILKKKPSA